MGSWFWRGIKPSLGDGGLAVAFWCAVSAGGMPRVVPLGRRLVGATSSVQGGWWAEGRERDDAALASGAAVQSQRARHSGVGLQVLYPRYCVMAPRPSCPCRPATRAPRYANLAFPQTTAWTASSSLSACLKPAIHQRTYGIDLCHLSGPQQRKFSPVIGRDESDRTVTPVRMRCVTQQPRVAPEGITRCVVGRRWPPDCVAGVLGRLGVDNRGYGCLEGE